MTATELIGLLLAVVGLAFAFETPRRWFLRLVRLQRAAAPFEGEFPRPTSKPSAAPIEAEHKKSTSSPEAAALESAAPPSVSSITVEEIVDSINSAPPFQRNSIEAQYVGIRVEWEGFLRDVVPDPRNEALAMVNLILDKSRVVGYSIWFSEHPERFPEIKTLQRDSKVRVAGTIQSASGPGLCVTLRPDSVRVLERAG